MTSNQHPERSAAGATEHEPHYSTDDASAGRALAGSTTTARGFGQTRYVSLNDRIKQMLQDDPILRQMMDELPGEE